MIEETPARPRAPQTRLTQAGRGLAPTAGLVHPPLERASTILTPTQADLYRPDLKTYGRSGLAPHRSLAALMTELEGGAGAVLAPTGVAAITLALMTYARAGDAVLITDNVYAPTRKFCDQVLSGLGVQAHYFDPRDLAALAADWPDKTRLVFAESPGSLTFELTDLPALAGMCRARGAKLMIDNTWGAGLALRPLALGADISIQSLTKYVSGGSDLFGGACVAATVEDAARLDQTAFWMGLSLSPDECYALQRSARSIHARFRASDAAAQILAQRLAGHKGVRAVLHPGLATSPDHLLWRRDFTGAAGVFGLVLEAPAGPAGAAFCDRLRLFGNGYSYGGFESLCLWCDPQLGQRKLIPRPDGSVVRLAIGAEDVEDLWADLVASFQT